MEDSLSALAETAWYAPHWLLPATLQHFEWQQPGYLYGWLALPALWLLRGWSRLYRRRMPLSLPKKTFKGRRLAAWLSALPTLFMTLSLGFLLLSLARPQKTSEAVERWTEGIDIVLLIDVSESMRIEDFTPNRLEAAKKVAKAFTMGRFQDRIGIVVFSGEAFSKAPLTTDYALISNYIEEIDFKIIEKSGTAIGSALAVGTNRLRESDSQSKVIILLSDGDNTAGSINPTTAAKIAHAYGIKIYTIGIGKEGKVPYGRDMWGRRQYLDNTLDEGTLREIASVGAGEFFRASNNKTLEKVFSEINQLEKTEIKERHYKNTVDYYPIYLKWCIACFLVFLSLKGSRVSNVLED